VISIPHRAMTEPKNETQVCSIERAKLTERIVKIVFGVYFVCNGGTNAE